MSKIRGDTLIEVTASECKLTDCDTFQCPEHNHAGGEATDIQKPLQLQETSIEPPSITTTV